MTRTVLGHEKERIREGTLTVIKGEASHARIDVGTAPIVVGRGEGCNLRFPHDKQVSNVHFELVAGQYGVTLLERGSRNGTFVDGQRVREMYLSKPSTIDFGGASLRFEPGASRTVAVPKHERFGAVIGSSVEMRKLFEQLETIAASDISVLITGETGSGKEVVARAIHDASRRASRVFQTVDCASLPPNLIEAELFGHAKGAFTGAHETRIGAFEAAEGGTLFLDELGELPIDVQSKLLRPLEAREFRRIGETHFRKVDVRVIAATNRDLFAMINAKQFRPEVFFRLRGHPLDLLPLRKRREDIPALVEHRLRRNGLLSPKDYLTAATLAPLLRYEWPGNVRQLFNVVDRAHAQWNGGPIDLASALELEKDVWSPPIDGPHVESTRQLPDVTGLDVDAFPTLREHRRDYLAALVKKTKGNVSAMARISGVERSHLATILAELGLRAKPDRARRK